MSEVELFDRLGRALVLGQKYGPLLEKIKKAYIAKKRAEGLGFNRCSTPEPQTNQP